MGPRKGPLPRLLAMAMCLLASPALAQGPAPLPPLPVRTDTVLRAGTWVQYLLTRPRTQQVMQVRLSALSSEGGGQWFEIGITDSMRRKLVVKMLVEGALQAPRRVLRAIIQPQGQQPLELPAKLAARQLPRFSRDPSREQTATKIGKGPITVAAGRFEAEHFRLKEKGQTVDMWTSAQVAGWPLVKMQRPDLILELTAHGKNASSEVRGKPARLDERWMGGRKL